MSSSRADFLVIERLATILLLNHPIHVVLGRGYFSQSGDDGIIDVVKRLDAIGCNHSKDISLSKLTDSSALIQEVSDIVCKFGLLLASRNVRAVILCGDRWELLGYGNAAFLCRVPIFHISGGEVTEGAIDDSIRHVVTKLASLHFVSNYEFARNVSLMGEEDWRISVVGEVGLDELENHKFSSKFELSQKHSINLYDKLLLMTMHPSTNDPRAGYEKQIISVLKALEVFKDFTVIITAPGRDEGADLFIKYIKQFIINNTNCKYIPHLGDQDYINFINISSAVVGNSSSGLWLVPSLKTGSVNIGSRQAGRVSGGSVFHSSYDPNEIMEKINLAINVKGMKITNPYDPHEDSSSALRIAYAIDQAWHHEKFLTAKKFINNCDVSQQSSLLKGFT